MADFIPSAIEGHIYKDKNGLYYKVIGFSGLQGEKVRLSMVDSKGAELNKPELTWNKSKWNMNGLFDTALGSKENLDEKESELFTFSFDPDSGEIIVTYPDGIKTQRLQSIRGPEGRSVFDVWCQKKGILHPTAQDWEDFIQSLKGKDGYTIKGVDAPTPFEEWRSRQPKNASEDELTYDTFIKSITGPKGKDGYEGKDGKDAYEVWKEAQPEGKRSKQDYLNYISGKPGENGESAYETWLRLYPHNGQVTEEDFFRWLANLAASQAPQGDTYLPSIDVDGKLYFTNSRTGERSEIGHNVLGKDGKTYTPHVHNDYLWFEDEKGNRPFPPIHIKGDKGDKGERGKSAFELWRDDPLHPENAGKTLDDYLQSLKGADGRVVNTYHNELAELEDYTCPIHEINPYMIVSTDTLEGSESAEKAIELEKAKINGLRAEGEKYANHGSWIQEFFWWCAGADRPLLRMCPGEHSKYMGIGTIIFFTALMAWFSSFVALGLVTGESENPKPTLAIILPVAILIVGGISAFGGYKRYKLQRLRDHLNDTTGNDLINSSIKRFNYIIIWILGIIIAVPIVLVILCKVFGFEISAEKISWAAVFACVWSLMIFFLDRFITNTMYSDGKVTISWTELRSALPRIVIAIFLGIVISAPLELVIFKKEIQTQVTNDLDAQATTYRVSNSGEVTKKDSIIKELEDDLRNVCNNNRLIDKLKKQIEAKNKEKEEKVAKELAEVTKNTPNYSPNMTDEERFSAQARANDANAKDRENARSIASKEYDNEIRSLNQQLDTLTAKSDTTVIKEQIREYKKEKQTLILNLDKAVQTHRDSIENNVGLFAQLQALHALAYTNKDGKDSYKEWPDIWYTSWWFWAICIWLLLSLSCSRFYANAIVDKKDDKANSKNGGLTQSGWDKSPKRCKCICRWWKRTASWRKGFAIINPWLAVVAIICGCCNETLFHALPSYICSAVGMIMMLFILIDVSPVFYKMMLADGVYDKLLHKEKLLTEDAIRLNAAKSFAKVNDSAIGRLAPFVFGKTAGKIMEMLKEFKRKSAEIDLDKDGRPKMGYGQSQERKDIDETNSEVFSYVLDLKKRLVKASYLAWYRDMRDHVLATKEDNQTPPSQPEDEFPEFDDSRKTAITVELDYRNLAMLVGASEMLTASVRPRNESTPEIRWRSRNEKVATVDNGVITAIAPGVTEIIATCGDGSATCKVTVSTSSDEYDTEDVPDDANAVGSSETDSSESSEGEDIGDNIKDEDEDDEHEIKDDETFRDINK